MKGTFVVLLFLPHPFHGPHFDDVVLVHLLDLVLVLEDLLDGPGLFELTHLVEQQVVEVAPHVGLLVGQHTLHRVLLLPYVHGPLPDFGQGAGVLLYFEVAPLEVVLAVGDAFLEVVHQSLAVLLLVFQLHVLKQDLAEFETDLVQALLLAQHLVQ